jgi:hypothetical protein
MPTKAGATAARTGATVPTGDLTGDDRTVSAGIPVSALIAQAFVPVGVSNLTGSRFPHRFLASP